MILALELCEEIVVYGMVSDSYCRLDWRPGWGQGAGKEGEGVRPRARGSVSCVGFMKGDPGTDTPKGRLLGKSVTFSWA